MGISVSTLPSSLGHGAQGGGAPLLEVFFQFMRLGVHKGTDPTTPDIDTRTMSEVATCITRVGI